MKRGEREEREVAGKVARESRERCQEREER